MEQAEDLFSDIGQILKGFESHTTGEKEILVGEARSKFKAIEKITAELQKRKSTTHEIDDDKISEKVKKLGAIIAKCDNEKHIDTTAKIRLKTNKENVQMMKQNSKEIKKEMDVLVKSKMSLEEKIKQVESIDQQIWKEIEALDEIKDLNLKKKKIALTEALYYMLEMNALSKHQWRFELEKVYEEEKVTASQISNEDMLKEAKIQTKKFEKEVKALEKKNLNTIELLEKGKMIGVQMFRLLDQLDELINIGDDLIEKRKNIERALILITKINDANIDNWEKKLDEEMKTLEARESSITTGAPQMQETKKPSEISHKKLDEEVKKSVTRESSIATRAPQKQETKKPSDISHKEMLAAAKKETKKFEEMIRSFQLNGGNEELKKIKTIGLEMLRLLERIDCIENVRGDLKKKKEKQFINNPESLDGFERGECRNDGETIINERTD